LTIEKKYLKLLTTKKFKIFAYIFAVSLVSAGWYFYYFLLPHAIERDKLLQKYIPEEVEYIALYGFEKAKNYKKRIRANITEKMKYTKLFQR
jgi:hypothetical protein